MKILHRYLVKGFFWPLVFCVLLFILTFVFVDSLSNLDEFIKKQAPAGIVIAYYFSLVPIIWNQIMPAACLMAVLYALGQLNKQNEITAMKASGISSARILAPVLMLGAVLSMCVFAVNETLTPEAAARSAAIKKGLLEFGHKDLSEKSLANVTLITATNKLAFAREMRLDALTLHDVILLEQYPSLAVKSKTTAQRAVFEGDRWIFYGAVHTEFDEAGEIIGRPEPSERLASDVRETPGDFIRQDTEARYMNYRQLAAYIASTRATGFKTSERLLVDLHQKLSSPLTSLIILLVGAPMALRIRRGGAWMSLGLGLAIVAGYYLAIAVSTALGKGGVLPPVAAAWLPHGMFLLVGIYLVRKYI